MIKLQTRLDFKLFLSFQFQLFFIWGVVESLVESLGSAAAKMIKLQTSLDFKIISVFSIPALLPLGCCYQKMVLVAHSDGA